MKNALIVLNYNDYHTCKRFVERVSNYDNINKIIIVDNHSSDESYNELKKIVNKKIDLITTPVNKGYAYGNNWGIRYAETKYKPQFIIISNPDVEFDEKIINELQNKLIIKDEYAVATATMSENGKTRNVIASKLPGYAHIILSTMPIIGRVYNNRFIRYKNEYFNSDYSEVEVVPGSFFIAKLDAIKCINYLDEKTFLYCEEDILGFKLKEKGYKSLILNNYSYEHKHSISIDKSIKENVKKHIILQESRKVYLSEYLRIGNVKKSIFNIITYISIIERSIIDKFKNIIRGK